MKSVAEQAIQASMYGHSVTYPNSENIKPPLEKERIRVVEAATRTEIASYRVKEIEERIEEINILRQQAAVRYAPNGDKVPVAYTQGEFVNIEV
jgi:hypothetical protein